MLKIYNTDVLCWCIVFIIIVHLHLMWVLLQAFHAYNNLTLQNTSTELYSNSRKTGSTFNYDVFILVKMWDCRNDVSLKKPPCDPVLKYTEHYNVNFKIFYVRMELLTWCFLNG